MMMITVAWKLLCCLWVMLQVFASEQELCNIPSLPLAQLEFGGSNYNSLPDFPLIYRDEPFRQSTLSREGSFSSLHDTHGDVIAELSSSNTFSHGRRQMKLSEYLDTLSPIGANGNSTIAANETFYLFGHNYAGLWASLTSQYVIPPCKFCEQAGAVTLGIGGPRSGVSFHFHGPGFSEVIVGGKKWFLFPSRLTKTVEKFGANTTMAAWFDKMMPKLTKPSTNDNKAENRDEDVSISGDITIARDLLSAEDIPTGFTAQEWRDLADNLHACTIYPGDILYFPAQWMHATLNTEDYNLFVSVFIDPQLI